MGLSIAEAMANVAREDSIGSLGYANGFEYFQYNGEVYRAPYENPISTQGYRQGARFESRFLTATIVGMLSDRDGNPIPNPEGRYQIRKSIGIGWYVTDTLGDGAVARRDTRHYEIYFKTLSGAENFRAKLQG